MQAQPGAHVGVGGARQEDHGGHGCEGRQHDLLRLGLGRLHEVRGAGERGGVEDQAGFVRRLAARHGGSLCLQLLGPQLGAWGRLFRWGDEPPGVDPVAAAARDAGKYLGAGSSLHAHRAPRHGAGGQRLGSRGEGGGLHSGGIWLIDEREEG